MRVPGPVTSILCTAVLIALAGPHASASRSAGGGGAAETESASLKRLQPGTEVRPVCCRIGRRHTMRVLKKCRDAGGTPVGARFCRQGTGKQICCKLRDGRAVVNSHSRCTAVRGTVMHHGYCRQTVCCKSAKKQGYAFTMLGSPEVDLGPLHYAKKPRIQCSGRLTQTIHPDTMCRKVCCKIPVTNANWHEFGKLSYGDCQEQQLPVVPDNMCRTVCCKAPDGYSDGHIFVERAYGYCKSRQYPIVSMTMCTGSKTDRLRLRR